MVKSNLSFGGKLLLIIITVLLTIALEAGAIFAVYKLVKVRKLSNFFLGDSDWVSEDYDGTIEDFVKELSTALSGEVTVNKLTEISPKLGEKINGVVDNLEKAGVFKLNRENLYATPFDQISSNLSDMLVITGTLNTFSESFGFSLPELPLISGENAPDIYSLVNKNDDGSVSDTINEEFLWADTEFSFHTRALQAITRYTDESGIEAEIAVWKSADVYTLNNVTEKDGYLYLTGKKLYFAAKNTADAVYYAPLTSDSQAVVSFDAETSTAQISLSETEDVCIVTGPDTSGENEWLYQSVKPASPSGSTSEAEIAAPYRYTPLYVQADKSQTGAVQAGDAYYICANVLDSTGNYAIDETKGGYKIHSDYNGKQLFALEYVYSPALSETDAVAEAAKGTEVYAHTKGLGDLPIKSGLDALADVLDIKNLALKDLSDYFGVALTGNAMTERLLYVPLSRFSESANGEIMNFTLTDFFELDQNSPKIMLWLAYGTEGIDYTIDAEGNIICENPRKIGELTDSLDSMRISDVITIDDSSHKLIQAIGDWTLSDFSKADKINSIRLGDVLTVDENSPAILKALSDYSLGEIGGAIDNLTLGEIFEVSPDDKLLSSLQNSTLQTLSQDLADLPVQALFADSIYKYNTVGTFEDYESLKAVYGENNLYVHERGGYFLYNSYTAEKLEKLSDKNLYSPYLLVSTDDTKYEGVLLYILGSDGTMTAATDTIGWKLPAQEDLPEGVDSFTKFYLPSGAGYTEVNGPIFAQSYVYYFDGASEQMKKLNLVASEYGVTPDNESKNLFTRLSYAGTFADIGSLTNYGNLFCFDVERERWIQLSEKGGNWTANGMTLTAETKLYTYGEITGIWKYMLKDKTGKEQICKIQDIDSLIFNVSGNINNATLQNLYDDGILDLDDSSVLSKKLPKDSKTIGEYKIKELLAKIGQIAS